MNKSKICTKCNQIKLLSEFYLNSKRPHSYCKLCMTKNTIDRQRKFKKECVEYKGGCCEKCGYSKYIGALEFHHKDPSKKEFSIAHVKLTTFSDKIRTELDKCELLCANCHREAHIEI